MIYIKLYPTITKTEARLVCGYSYLNVYSLKYKYYFNDNIITKRKDFYIRTIERYQRMFQNHRNISALDK